MSGLTLKTSVSNLNSETVTTVKLLAFNYTTVCSAYTDSQTGTQMHNATKEVLLPIHVVHR